MKIDRAGNVNSGKMFIFPKKTL